MGGSSSAISQAALDRLNNQAAGQLEANSTQLALTPYEYGLDPGAINQPPTNPTAQDLHPSAQRLATNQWQGKTSQLNHAQAAAPGAPVWVTVPVDKVITRNGNAAVTPTYASTRGYVPRPGESVGSIPPPMPAGHPYF
jgi:hypothetical protein